MVVASPANGSASGGEAAGVADAGIDRDQIVWRFVGLPRVVRAPAACAMLVGDAAGEIVAGGQSEEDLSRFVHDVPRIVTGPTLCDARSRARTTEVVTGRHLGEATQWLCPQGRVRPPTRDRACAIDGARMPAARGDGFEYARGRTRATKLVVAPTLERAVEPDTAHVGVEKVHLLEPTMGRGRVTGVRAPANHGPVFTNRTGAVPSHAQGSELADRGDRLSAPIRSGARKGTVGATAANEGIADTDLDEASSEG
jgi:hypothetical protein